MTQIRYDDLKLLLSEVIAEYDMKDKRLERLQHELDRLARNRAVLLATMTLMEQHVAEHTEESAP